MKIFITGIAGFVASNVANRLHELGHEVSGIDNMKFGRMENLNPKIALYIGHMTFINRIKYHDADVLVHMACDNIIYSQDKPIETFKTNALRSIELINKYEGKIVYTSTASVYGQADFVPTHESADIKVYNAYDQSKYITELFLKQRGNYTTLRLSNVYGANQRPENPYAGVVAKTIDSVRKNEGVIIYGDGNDTRDYTYIDDTVNAIIKACEHNAMGTEINIGTGKETSVNRLVDIIRSRLNYQGKSCHIESRSIDKIQRRALDNNYAGELLGWYPTINIEEGIRKTIEWQTKNYIL